MHTDEVDVQAAVTETAGRLVEELSAGRWAEVEAEAGGEASGVGIRVAKVEEHTFGFNYTP